MKDTKEIEAIETDIARDLTRLHEIDIRESQLLGRQHEGFRDASEGARLRSEREMLDERVLHNKKRLIDANK